MTRLINENLSGAEAAFAVANTPLFLLRKLRSDAAVQKISAQNSATRIFQELKLGLKTKPETLTALVEPYVFLVALSQKDTLATLRRAQNLKAPYHPWFQYLAKVLLKSYAPTATAKITAPEMSRADQISRVSKTPTSVVNMTLDHNS